MSSALKMSNTMNKPKIKRTAPTAMSVLIAPVRIVLAMSRPGF